MTPDPLQPVRLDDLTVDELNEMASAIVGLKEAGYLMQEQGFDARFSLVPGLPATMHQSYRMPHPGPMADLVPARTAAPEWHEGQMPAPRADRPQGIPTWSPKTVDPAPQCPTAAQIDAAVTAACDKVLPRAAAMAAEGPAKKLEVRPVAAPPVAAPVPPKTEADSTAPGKPTPWTEGEDAQLVDLVAHGIVIEGKTKGASICAAAATLNRPVDGTGWRCNTKLKDRLASRIVDLRGPQPSAMAAAEVSAPADTAEVRPDALLLTAELSPIEKYLLDMPTKGGWTMEADLELLELSEIAWSIPEIATQMGKDGKAIADRFDLLTGFDRETKARKWKRADLLVAARAWTAKASPATAAE